MQIGTEGTARSELLISEPKTRVRPQAAASAHRAHPVGSSRDQQPQTGSGPRPEVLDYRKSTVPCQIDRTGRPVDHSYFDGVSFAAC